MALLLMRELQFHSITISAALAWGLSSTVPPAQQPPVFRTVVDTVRIYANVRDGQQFVPRLTREDFIVLDNGRPVEITQFATTPQPITAVVMLDMSASASPHFWLMRRFSLAFASTFRDVDRVRIGSFSDLRIAINPVWTREPARLERILREELWPGDETPLWNGLNAAMTAMAGEAHRCVVIVLTGGKNTASVPGFEGDRDHVRVRAAREDFMIYAVGLPEPGAALKQLAEESGGGWLQLSNAVDVEQAAGDVAAELHHQYLIGFAPIERDGRMHTIGVRTRNPGYNVRARTHYMAPGGRR